MSDHGSGHSAFHFDGNWRAYAPIAFTNILLMIVTLGLYRFWATTRTRQYLWSHSIFIDERLEWTGTGKELLVGFLMALLLFSGPFLIIEFGAQALALQGHVGASVLVRAAAGLTLLYLAGVARFRALRYRLSRTYWHGIRGGSNDAGFTYGLSWAWKTILGYFTVWLLVPWSMISLWNQRWRSMSFGSQQFRSEARTGPVFKRFLLFYLLPFLMVLVMIAAAATFGLTMMGIGVQSAFPRVWQILSLVVILVGVYVLLGLVALAYYAAFLREGIGNLSLGEIRFRFEATTSDWLNLFFVDVLLVIGTLGIGLAFLSYRHWKFFITHLEAYGEVSLSALGQSTTREPGQGEGLLDALDIGAF